MGSNHIENAFLDEAVKKLKPQYERVYGKYNGHFYPGCGIQFMKIEEGPDQGKLTIALQSFSKGVVPDPKITPVDYSNLLLPGEDPATAVARVFGGRSTPYTTITSE